jgi:Zn ribbon nucleic-acid-binding protein
MSDEEKPTKCPICGSDDILIIETEDGFKIYKCEQCGHAITYLVPSAHKSKSDPKKTKFVNLSKFSA